METAVAREEKNNRGIAVTGTIIFHAAILLFLFYFVIKTPIPPYPEVPKPEIILDFGNSINGTGNVEESNKGNNPSADNTTRTSVKSPSNQSANPVLTNNAENNPLVNTSKKPNKTDTTSTQQQKVDVNLANVLNKFSHSKGNPGGNGNSEQPGNAGDPNGKVPGTSMEGGNKGFEYSLKGRKLVTAPQISTNSQVEGKVVVEIVVDQTGNVIKAIPGVKGSTITTPVLLAKAKEAALQMKFNSSPDGTPQQQGTTTVIFKIQ